MIDFLGAIPLFILLIWMDPERYAESLKDSGTSIRKRMSKYRNEP